MKQLFILFAAAVLGLFPGRSLDAAHQVTPQVYDLKADWSDTQNPNGAWTYLDQWFWQLLSNDPFPWVDPLNGVVLSRTTAADAVSGVLEVGDIYAYDGPDSYGYAPGIRWTAPAPGSIDIAGAIWNTWDDPWGGDVSWELRHNGSAVLSAGFSQGSSRSEPADFSMGWNGPGALLNISVQAGDHVDLSFQHFLAPGNRFGIDFTVVFIPGPPDFDADGVPDEYDNCPTAANPSQADADSDGIGNHCDNCPYTWNPDQTDKDGNGIGDVCDQATSPNVHGNVVTWGWNPLVWPSGTPGGCYTAISAGAYHLLALRTDGSLVAWGCSQGFDCSPGGTYTGAMVTDTPGGIFTAIAAMSVDNVAMRPDGTLFGWGSHVTQMPTGTFSAIAPRVGIRTDGTLALLPGGQVPDPGTFLAVDGSPILGHFVAIRTDGTLFSWGHDNYGQVSDTPTGTFMAVSAGGNHSVAIRTDGTLVSWGRDHSGQVSGTPTGTFSAVAGGGRHSVAIRTDGTLVAWGSDDSGQVSGIPTTGKFSAVSAGWSFSAALRASANDIVWHQPLARNGGNEDTDPSAGGTLKYRFKQGSTIPIKIHVLGCDGADVTSNPNVIGVVEVFEASGCEATADGNALTIDYNGVGGTGGAMDKVGDHLMYNLDTSLLPQTTSCFILQVTITDTSTGEVNSETVPLQAK